MIMNTLKSDIILRLFFIGYLSHTVFAAHDVVDDDRIILMDILEKNSCAWKNSCTPNKFTVAEELCQAALRAFVALTQNERRLCGNPHDASCQFVQWRRVCSFVCDPTDWELSEAMRMRRKKLPKTKTKSLAAVLKPMQEAGGVRLKVAHARLKEQRRLDRIRQQLHRQPPPPPQHPLLPDLAW